jgi:hypothetical protein
VRVIVSWVLLVLAGLLVGFAAMVCGFVLAITVFAGTETTDIDVGPVTGAVAVLLVFAACLATYAVLARWILGGADPARRRRITAQLAWVGALPALAQWPVVSLLRFVDGLLVELAISTAAGLVALAIIRTTPTARPTAPSAAPVRAGGGVVLRDGSGRTRRTTAQSSAEVSPAMP